MCGTCKFYLGFFQVAALGSVGMMVTITAIYYIYGGMPPIFAMAAGFWIQYVAGWLSIYLTFYVVRVLGKGLLTKWTPKYCFGLIIAVIILYMAGGICFFVPVTKQRMLDYSHYYNKSLKRVPRFLDKFQEQYECCGINGYRDYKDPTLFGVDYLRVRQVYNDITPSDKNWEIDQEGYKKELEDDKSVKKPTARSQYFFNVPSSCCKHERRVNFKNCGHFVEYQKGEGDKKDAAGDEPDPSAMIMIHNDGTSIVGCYEKYKKIMEDSVFQLNWMLGIIRWGSLFQSFFFFFLIWIYRLSLKAMRKHIKETIRRHDRESHFLAEDEDEDEANIILPIQNKKKSKESQTAVKDKDGKGKLNKSDIADFFKDTESGSTLSSVSMEQKDGKDKDKPP